MGKLIHNNKNAQCQAQKMKRQKRLMMTSI